MGNASQTHRGNPRTGGRARGPSEGSPHAEFDERGDEAKSSWRARREMERQASDYGLTAVQYGTLKRFVQQGGRGLASKLRWDGDLPDYRDSKRPDWLDPEALFALESRHVLVHEWEYPEPASGRIRVLAADLGHQDLGRGRVRPCRTLCVTYANRNRSRLTSTKPPARTPFARTRRGCPVSRAWPEPIPRCTSHWPHSGCRQPKSLTRSLAGCRTMMDLQPSPKALFHLIFSRNGRRDRLSPSCCLWPCTQQSASSSL